MSERGSLWLLPYCSSGAYPCDPSKVVSLVIDALKIHFQVTVEAPARFNPKELREQASKQFLSFLAGFLRLPGVMQVDVEVEKGLLPERDVKNLAAMQGFVEHPGMKPAQDHFFAIFPIGRASAFLASILDGFGYFNGTRRMARVIYRPLVRRQKSGKFLPSCFCQRGKFAWWNTTI